jgi:hypothetical protein
MTTKSKQFLNFNGQNINVLSKDGTTWVAIKPICEALKVNYDRQFKNLKNHPLLNQLYANQHTVAKDDKLREMVCLPEKFIYGWLFSINSDSEDFLKYQLECYDILFNHFHGATTHRLSLLQQKSHDEKVLAELNNKLKEELKASPTYLQLQEVKSRVKGTYSDLITSDELLLENQLTLF